VSQATLDTVVVLAGLIAASSFVIGLHFMNSPATARNGNRISAAGMTLAVVVTLLSLVLREGGLSAEGWIVILAGFVIGGAIGLLMALRVAMTAMPQLVSLFNAVGGGAAALVAIFDYLHVLGGPEPETISTAVFVVLGVVVGSVTFSGSLIASGKLQGLISGRPIRVPGGTATTAILTFFLRSVGTSLAASMTTTPSMCWPTLAGSASKAMLIRKPRAWNPL